MQSVPNRDHTSYRPRLVIPLGDPAGIGPEVVIKAIADPALRIAADITLVGNLAMLPSELITTVETLDNVRLLEADLLLEEKLSVVPGQPTVATGHASFVWLETAIAGALAGKYDAIVTAPIAKSMWHAAGHDYPGQTEVLAERSGVHQFGMAFVARSPYTNWPLRCLLATTHISLRQVPITLNPTLMTQKLTLLIDCLRRDFGITAPHLAIPGLNPHSGEAGKLGTEERDWLIPWLDTMRQQFPQLTLTGPLPPDTLWVSAGQAWYREPSGCPYDGYLALYHDQGLIPIKLLAFDRAVNTTIGLPFIRTSPDHGTAFDIAGQGIAQADSTVAAIKLAVTLTHQRRRSLSHQGCC
jgi:4-hydroxythreonine-4-phosphate dehydrogenase